MDRRAALATLTGAAASLACSPGGPPPAAPEDGTALKRVGPYQEFPDWDICIYGATSGGIVAAIQAARMGKYVVVLDPSEHMGGMTSGGLAAVDIGDPRTVGGIAREFFGRLAGRYGRRLAWDEPIEGVPSGGGFAIEPRAAETLFADFVREEDIPIVFHSPLMAVRKEGARIRSIVAGRGIYSAKVFIDATYEGDLMAKAGVRYTVAREGNDKYGETLNGILFHPRYEPKTKWGVAGPNGRRPDGKGLWDRDIPIDPYIRPGVPTSGVLPLVEPGEPGEPGRAAPGVQAYCFRLCLTRTPENRIPLEKPEGYDSSQYELVARFIAACVRAGDDMDLRWFSKHDPLPGDKFDFNTATFGSNLPGASWTWAEARWDRRLSILTEHERYHRGLLWFLRTDSRVPPKVRQEIGAFGLCRDEFRDTEGWPHQIYVREGRRMVSDLVLTERHCRGEEVAPESVGLGSYGMDLHEIRRVVKDGIVWREGKGGGRVPAPYPIGYRAIIPRQHECDNLLVTFALSASHVAFGSTRMEPPFMILSQSAATAAAIALDAEIPVQWVDYGALSARLREDGQVLDTA